MSSIMITMCKLPVLILMLMSLANGQDRKITSQLNPGCEDCPQDTILVYIKCEGSADTIHQIWDFTKHAPTFILAVSSLNSTLNITWDRSTLKKFSFTEKPKYSFATSVDKLVEYNDIDGNGHIDPSFPQREYDFDRVAWHLEGSRLTDKEAMVQVSGRMGNRRRNGTVRFKLDLLPFRDYAADLPHLVHTANSTLIDVKLVNLTTSPEYNRSRYAVHLVLVSTDDVASTMHTLMRKSLDDEHTPGVFEIIEIKSPSLYTHAIGGYLQFRPVGYTAAQRSVGSSTVAHVTDFTRMTLPRRSTLRLFYEGLEFDSILVQGLSVSFGDSGDGFYEKYNYTDWSFALGYGSPPVEGFSLFVILVIAIGLGVPVLLAISGVIVVLRRPRNHVRLQ